MAAGSPVQTCYPIAYFVPNVQPPQLIAWPIMECSDLGASCPEVTALRMKGFGQLRGSNIGDKIHKKASVLPISDFRSKQTLVDAFVGALYKTGFGSLGRGALC